MDRISQALWASMSVYATVDDVEAAMEATSDDVLWCFDVLFSN